jgi:glycosyltransferase involved in cell wall biosynthesis
LQILPGKKILFISHEASRSGAPIVLLHLLNWLKKNSSFQFEILLLSDGPLKPDFEQLGKTFVLNDLTGQYTYPGRIKKKILGTTINDQYKKTAYYLSKRKYDLVYGNTIVSLPWLKIFKEDCSLKALCCIHELTYALNCFFSDEYLEKTLKLMDGIIAVSGAVKENLVNTFNLSADKVQLHYEFIDTDKLPSINKSLKTDLNIKPYEFIIGTGGALSWRKGTDLLIPLTIKLIELYPDFKFRIIWLGADSENEFVKQLLYDAKKCGISGKLIFLESKPNPLDFINLADIFVLLSREDPFPLIVLEAAFLKKPIIAFENSGGIPELIAQGAGLQASYLNIAQVAEWIYKLSNDIALSNKLANKAKELVISKYSSSVISPQIYGSIMELIKPGFKIDTVIDNN